MVTEIEQRDDLLSRTDVAHWLGISEWAVKHLETAGELTTIRFGHKKRSVRYRRSDVEAFIERHRVDP